MTNTESKTQPTQEQISARAYELWEADGRPSGRDQDYWYQAIAHFSRGAQSSGQNTSANASRREQAAQSQQSQQSQQTQPSSPGTQKTETPKTESGKKRKNEGQQVSSRRQPAFA